LTVIQNHPVYSIGVVSELLGVHPETIRTWEKSGVVYPPQRRSGKRFYSDLDYKRLQFIHKLIGEGLTLRAIHYYLRLYPCWKTSNCPGCLHNSNKIGSTKPCWQELDTNCQVANSRDPCSNCRHDTGQRVDEAVETKPLDAHNQQGTQAPSAVDY
jgi:DNA-binding transcriptional MerR regulator